MKTTTLYRVTRGLGWFSITLGAAEVLAPRALGRFLGAQPSVLWTRLFGLREITAGVGLLSGRKATPWLWGRVAGDALDLAALTKILSSPKANPASVTTAIGSVAAITAVDICCALKASKAEAAPIFIAERITVGRSAGELYEWWRSPEKLARIMEHAAEVSPVDEQTLHWKLKTGGIAWKAQFTDERPGELLRWQSVSGMLVSEGSIRFVPAPGDHGTEVVLTMQFQPPGLAMGSAVAQALKALPEKLTLHALRRFKSLAETGEIPTLDQNPTARPGASANII